MDGGVRYPVSAAAQEELRERLRELESCYDRKLIPLRDYLEMRRRLIRMVLGAPVPGGTGAGEGGVK
jgi:hypothetical protein